MAESGERTEPRPEPQLASEGTGPLLERDYSAVIVGTDRSPEQIMEMVRQDFPKFAPPETASFSRQNDATTPLEPGDDLNICISLLGTCKVRVAHVDPLGLTLQTLEGHPEAGRITFAAGRDDRGRTTFRIRSRTRAAGWVHYLGFLVLGKQMQSRCWIRYIKNLARATGGHIQGNIEVRTYKVDERAADRGERVEPTVPAGRGS